MRNVAIAGAAMTRFGKYADRGMKEMIREGGRRLPVNTSGGLISKGHPIGATGVYG